MKNNKLTILFDANPIANKNKTGIGIYSTELLRSLAEVGDESVHIYAYYFNFLGRKRIQMPAASNITYKKVVLYPGALVNLLRRLGIELPVEFFTKKAGDFVIFPNYLTHPSLFGAKIIPIVHDLTHVLFPQYMSAKNQADLEKFVPKSLARSKVLITISKSTKNDILKTYKYDKPILITPIPFNKYSGDFFTLDKLMTKYKIKKDYILFVGTLEPRKNLMILLKAFEINNELSKKFSLVLCGGVDWKYEETLNKIVQLVEKGISIATTGYVDEKTKNSLYKNCAVFTMPSQYEGFGMPIIEASEYKAPLALSDIPVFHEVAGSSAIYFNQNSAGDIAAALLSAYKKPIRYGSLLENYTWNQNAQLILDILRKIK